MIAVAVTKKKTPIGRSIPRKAREGEALAFPGFLELAAGGLRLVGALLLDFFDLVDEVVGLLGQCGAFIGAFHGVRFAAIEEVEIGHRVVVVGTELDGFLQVGNAFVDQGALFGEVVGAHGRRQRIGILDLFIDVFFIVVHAYQAIGAKGQGPIDDTDPVVRFGVVGLQSDVLLMIGLGLLELGFVKGGAGHLE